MAEFSKYRFSRKEIDFQPNEVSSDMNEIDIPAVATMYLATYILKKH